MHFVSLYYYLHTSYIRLLLLTRRSSCIKQEITAVSAIFLYHSVVRHDADFPASQGIIPDYPCVWLPAYHIDEGFLRVDSSIGIIVGINGDVGVVENRHSVHLDDTGAVVLEYRLLVFARHMAGSRCCNGIHDGI